MYVTYTLILRFDKLTVYDGPSTRTVGTMLWGKTICQDEKEALIKHMLVYQLHKAENLVRKSAISEMEFIF